MKVYDISSYDDFEKAMDEVGFTLLGGNDEGIFSMEPGYSPIIEYHTGNADTDPWQWRMRAVRETVHISYGKVFKKKSGFITKEWLPYFIAVRRKGKSAEELYEDGLLSRHEKQVYDFIEDNGGTSLSKLILIMGRDEKKHIERALTGLQMKMLISVHDETYKLSKLGLPYGWPVSVYCTMDRMFTGLQKVDPVEAEEKIRQHIMFLNPDAKESDISKFIGLMK